MGLQDTIQQLQRDLRSGRFTNEAAVSQGAVLPVLSALGWPVFDTSTVAPEYTVEGRRVDFALCHSDERPIVFLEVKRVGGAEGADRQLFEYAFHKGVPLAVLTDGQEWHFYLPAEQGDYQDRRVYKLDLLERDIAECRSRLERYLSHEAVASGRAIEAARSDYRDVSRQRQIQQALPRAWDKLLEEPDEILMELLADKAEDLCGFKPDPDTCARFLEASGKPSSFQPPSPQRRPPHQPEPPRTRTTGAGIGFVFQGEQHRTGSAREVMTSLFQRLAAKDSTFLERFAARKHGRKRRFVARDKFELYPQRRDLCENCSFEVAPGWFIGTNYAKLEIEKIVRLACEVAGLRFGRDVVINLGE